MTIVKLFTVDELIDTLEKRMNRMQLVIDAYGENSPVVKAAQALDTLAEASCVKALAWAGSNGFSCTEETYRAVFDNLALQLNLLLLAGVDARMVTELGGDSTQVLSALESVLSSFSKLEQAIKPKTKTKAETEKVLELEDLWA